LTQPYSPHKSAALDGITIDPRKITPPETANNLVIEGAGGLMVPLNNTFLMIDLIKQLNAAVILVSQNYLGSINHTILSVDVLKQRNIPVKGIIFNGSPDSDSEQFILSYSEFPLLGHIRPLAVVDKVSVAAAGKSLIL